MSIPDLAPITRHLRAKASSHLLVAAVHYLNVFEELSSSSLSLEELQAKLKLKDRPAKVLFPALCAMDLLRFNNEGKLELTETGKYLTQNHKPNLLGYTGLEKNDPAVAEITKLLLNDGPENKESGVSYVKDEEGNSPMDDPEASRFFTQALAGRAEFLSPIVASNLPKSDGHLLDVAGGSGFYSFEWLVKNPKGTATLIDRPEVLKVSREFMDVFCNSGRPAVQSIRSRITFLPGDMLVDELPKADILLAASLFHDWPEEVCIKLAQKFAKALIPGGQLWAHDAFLNDSLDGPIAVTDYSTMLFTGTKGRAYSRKEYRNWLTKAGLINTDVNIPTLMDYGLINAIKKLDK